MKKKGAALIALLILVALAVLIAPWVMLPIFAGGLTALAIYLGSRQGRFPKVIRTVKAISVVLAVMIAVWFIVSTPFKPKATRTSLASKTNLVLSRLTGGSTRPSQPGLVVIERDRLSLRAALQMERQKVKLISRALDLYDVGRMEYQAQAESGNPDQDLNAALLDFHSVFEKERPDSTGSVFHLLAPDELQTYLERTSQAIDKLEGKDLATATDSQSLRQCRLRIPFDLKEYQLDQLYSTVTNLQNRLKNSLKVQFSPASTYTVKYNREQNAIISEQRTAILLSRNPASEIDLTGFFTSQDRNLTPNLSEEIGIQEDSFPEQIVQPRKATYSLRPTVNQVVISKRIIRANASERVIGGSLPVQLYQVKVDWPLLPSRGVTLALQERNNPISTWPFVLPIENKDDASLSRIMMPRYAVYFVDPAIDKMERTASSDELTPSASVGNLRALVPASAQVIRIELLPRYLSNSTGQKLKEYLAVENLVAAVILWLITVVGLGMLRPSHQ